MPRCGKFSLQRENYPILKEWVYLDNPSAGLIPQYSCDAMCDYIKNRTVKGMSYNAYVSNWEFADTLRSLIGKFIGCDGSDIAYGLNQSQLFNIFANGLGLKAENNVILPFNTYEAARFTMLRKECDGIKIKFARTNNFATKPEDVFSLVDDNTRAIILCHVEHSSGFKHNLEVYGEFCHKNNIWLAVDATQSCGAMHLNVEEMKIDFLVSSCYKWVQGLLGIAFAYISKPLRKKLKLNDSGWAGTKERLKINFYPDDSEDSRRFECGSLNITALKGVEKTVENYLRLGGKNIERHILSLTDYFYCKVKTELEDIKILGDFLPENRSSIVTIKVPEWVNDEIAKQERIRIHCMSPGKLRLGFHYYNNKADIDCFTEFLNKISKINREK